MGCAWSLKGPYSSYGPFAVLREQWISRGASSGACASSGRARAEPLVQGLLGDAQLACNGRPALSCVPRPHNLGCVLPVCCCQRVPGFVQANVIECHVSTLGDSLASIQVDPVMTWSHRCCSAWYFLAAAAASSQAPDRQSSAHRRAAWSRSAASVA